PFSRSADEVERLGLGVEILPVGVAAAEQPFLGLEKTVERFLDPARVAQRLPHFAGHPAAELPQLGAELRWDGLDAIPVHLLQRPEHAVGGLEAAVEGVATPVRPAYRLLLLLDPAARSIDHELLFQAYRLP